MIEYRTNEANARGIAEHLFLCMDDFVPPLRERGVNIPDYAKKIAENATQFEAWDDDLLVGLVAVYEHEWFVTNVSVLPSHQRHWIASELLHRCIIHAQARGAKQLSLKVDGRNERALRFYTRNKFIAHASQTGNDGALTMTRELLSVTTLANACNKVLPTHVYRSSSPFPERLTQQDFDAATRDTPTHKYTYDFDFEVMHPMMIRTFEPWFRKDYALELGSYEGVFTKRLLDHFCHITCVEASRAALSAAVHLPVLMINETFEDAHLVKQYNNIFMTHVLEHVADPVRVLKRVNDEWLAPGGRFFLACPNANAASRQIAFQMGKLKSLHGVTQDEHAHGHHRTYSLDLLECHARNAGLKVISRGGIFFKALANFQLDKAKAAGIIDDAYLEGCYQLGQIYPDLCASVYLICEKGEVK